MKEYFYQIMASDILLAVAFAIILLLFLLLYASFLNIKHVFSLFLLGFGFSCYAILFLFDIHLNIIPFNPDINIYTKIFNNPSYYYLNESMMALKSFALFCILIKPFLFNSILNYTLLHIFIFFIACVHFVAIFSHFYSRNSNPNFQSFYFLVIAFLPSGLLFITQPIRDAWLVFGFSLFIYGLFYLSNVFIKYFVILSGFLVSFWVRPQIFIFEFIYLLSFHFFRFKHKIILGLLFVMLIFSASPIITSLTHVKLNPSYLAYFRQENIVKHGDNLNVYGSYSWSSSTDLVSDGPLLFFQFLLAPLPIVWTGNFTNMILASLDAFIIVFLLLVILFHFKQVLMHYFLWLACIIMFFAIFGLVEFHITAALRHRLPGTIMLITLAAKLLFDKDKSEVHVNA